MSVEDVKNKYYPALDQGWVRLVDSMGDDASILEAARTSYTNGQGSGQKKSSDRDLLRYLYRNLHTSPFEMVELKFHCIGGDNRIATDKGVLRADAALDAMLLHDTYQPSEGAVIKSGKKPLFRLSLDRGYSLTVTMDHPVYTFDKQGVLSFKPVQELASTDYLVLSQECSAFHSCDYSFPDFQYSKRTHTAKRADLPKSMTADLAELVGYYMGDGTITPAGLEFPVTVDSPGTIQRVAELCKTVFGLVPRVNRHNGMAKVRINSVEVSSWWRSMGLSKVDAWSAFIPDAIWASSPPVMFGFFRGLFGADGTVSDTNGVSLTTVSERLANEVQTLLTLLGVPMTKVWRPDNFVLYTFTNQGLQRYRQLIGFTCPEKNLRLAELTLRFTRTEAIPNARGVIRTYDLPKERLASQLYAGCNLPREHSPPELSKWIYLGVKSIEPLGEQEVWDATVPSTEQFLANGLVVHNCKMPIFVARQWIRHRTASVNEMSGRYVEMPQEFYVPPIEQVKLQSRDNKQGRAESLSLEEAQQWLDQLETQRAQVSGQYLGALKSGVAKELARIDLPVSTYTQWYWKIDLHNLLNFLRLRYDGHAQWEIRVYAEILLGILQEVVPQAVEAWVDYRHCARLFSRLDLMLLQTQLTTGNSPTLELAREVGMTKREWEEYQSKTSQVPEVPAITLPAPIPCPGSG